MVQKIIETFERFRMPATAIDQYQSVGKAKLAKQLTTFTTAGSPIEFVMLGYPMKSPNARDKVLGVLPDFGEQASMDNFAAFGNAIKSIYNPGINITIVSDGYVFSDVVGVSDKVVAAYQEALTDMTTDAPVQIYNLTDFYNKKTTLASAREKLNAQFGITDQELEQRILFDADVNALYRGMIRFMELDLAIDPYNSANQLHKAAKRTARAMMLRNEAYSQLVSNEFQHSIRLSMHQGTNTKKFGFQLIPGNQALHSPWHSVVVDAGGDLMTMHKKDAQIAGYQLVYKHGQPYNYVIK